MRRGWLYSVGSCCSLDSFCSSSPLKNLGRRRRLLTKALRSTRTLAYRTPLNGRASETDPLTLPNNLLTFGFCSLYCGAVEENGNGPCIEQQARIKWRSVPLPYRLSRAGRHPLNLAPAFVLTGSVYERLCRIRIPEPKSRQHFAAKGVCSAFAGKADSQLHGPDAQRGACVSRFVLRVGGAGAQSQAARQAGAGRAQGARILQHRSQDAGRTTDDDDCRSSRALPKRRCATGALQQIRRVCRESGADSPDIHSGSGGRFARRLLPGLWQDQPDRPGFSRHAAAVAEGRIRADGIEYLPRSGGQPDRRVKQLGSRRSAPG